MVVVEEPRGAPAVASRTSLNDRALRPRRRKQTHHLPIIRWHESWPTLRIANEPTSDYDDAHRTKTSVIDVAEATTAHSKVKYAQGVYSGGPRWLSHEGLAPAVLSAEAGRPT